MTMGLCVCHHWQPQHSAGTFKRPCTVQGCSCDDYFNIGKGSSCRWHPGAITGREKVGDLEAGHKILIIPNDACSLLPAAQKRAAYVATVKRLRYVPGGDGYHKQAWRWIVETDLGDLGPVVGSQVVTTMVRNG